ncbi:MAG TPA: hypothetical protein VD884_10100 [Ohtaekwangia sp.]|nr:hypothetical protein [Ohtaekwangia sp.]
MAKPVFDNSFDFSTMFIANNSYFYLNTHVNSYDDNGKNFIITDYSYDEESGNLKFNFTYSYSDYNDETVEVSGKVNVIVYRAQLLG